MTIIHLIIGLPGSGKTHYAKTVLGHLPLVDDPKTMLDLLVDADEFVIADCNLCDSLVRTKAVKTIGLLFLDCEIRFVYFENDPVKAKANVERRNDGRNVVGTIERFTKMYNPPAHAFPIYVDNDHLKE